jgi:hypothetical protein
MAVSLAITAAGILIGYRLFDIQHEAGRTLNATLVHDIADGWNRDGLPWGTIFVALTLLAEGSLLFVAAQTGFLGGPRMLASMAVDRWVPNRFANLSSRLVTGNGVLLMAWPPPSRSSIRNRREASGHHVQHQRLRDVHALAARHGAALVDGARARRGLAVATASERQRLADLVQHSCCHGVAQILPGRLGDRARHRQHGRHGVPGAASLQAVPVRAHDAQPAGREHSGRRAETGRRQSAAIFVNRYDGLGLHTLGRVRSLMGQDLRKVVFLSVVQVDSDQFRDEAHIESLRLARAAELQRYEAVARSAGLETESAYALGTDVVEELELLAVGLASRAPSTVFVAGQVVFQQETLTMRLLHNEVAFALQRRLLYRGLDIIIVPVQLPAEIW